jgi:succinyl-CoA synthetase alpha subunit
MAILVDADTKVICQGITGSFGAVHTKGCLTSTARRWWAG